ncbi:DNA-binding CsgD family transcriptional regulator [Micromonospora jinlongensis]|uniref:DNA-binding CsgD family transcriptional regulator n=1 Tax=Micromonospora jinlongensis TaxID=1287877 RepID=A0A7Y9X3N8_9ACTN|nr:AAA family ATPase [Micromonospora jinlongensis]NYH44394.1 DNA-binding CsgD family transcriptional regulator [Micromonospora jinlongensis]
MMPVSMVGRAGELAELDRAWSVVSAAGRSTPTVAVITGAAGVGKSLLVAAAVDALTPRPAMILSGAARVHGPAPYDWLAAVLTGRDTGRLALPPDALAWLAQQPTAPRERYAPGTLLRLAVRTVQLLVGAGPAVLVVEDLHALDPASVNLIGELATVAELPALLVVASRPAADAVAPELTRRALARLSGVRGAVRQHLGPLRQAEVAEVLTQVYEGCDPSDRLVASLWRCTGGNPYALTELLAAHAGDGPEALLRRLPEPRPPVEPIAAVDPVAAVDRELTAREVEVLGCLVDGMSNKQVAKALGISVRTVTVHVSNLLRKTGSASRTEVALWAVRRRPPVPAPVD